jgi:hypothetical protein
MEERDDLKSLNINVSAPPGGGKKIGQAVSIAICILVFVASFYLGRKQNVFQQYDKKRDDSIQKSYDGQLKSKDDSLRRLDIKIQQYELVIDSLRERYKANIVKIESIKTKHNEKAKLIDTLSDDGLIRFFTDRYGQKK